MGLWPGLTPGPSWALIRHGQGLRGDRADTAQKLERDLGSISGARGAGRHATRPSPPGHVQTFSPLGLPPQGDLSAPHFSQQLDRRCHKPLPAWTITSDPAMCVQLDPSPSSPPRTAPCLPGGRIPGSCCAEPWAVPPTFECAPTLGLGPPDTLAHSQHGAWARAAPRCRPGVPGLPRHLLPWASEVLPHPESRRGLGDARGQAGGVRGVLGGYVRALEINTYKYNTVPAFLSERTVSVLLTTVCSL